MPVASTLLGLSSVENENPLFAGMVGLHGNYAANMMTNQCDVLIAVGMRFSDRVVGNPEKYANQASIIHIEIDPSEVGKIISPSVAIISDAKSALQKMLPLIRKSSHVSWLDEMRKFQAKENETVINENLSKLRMGRVVRTVSEKKSGSAVVVTDVGQNQMASARYFKFQDGDAVITSGGLGTMGFALPAAIGASYAKKFQNVLCIMGDGGFQMTIEELGAVMQYRLPVKMVLLNNNYLGMIRQLQDLYYNSHYYFGEMQNPDFVKIADAYGIPAEKITNLENLDSAVERMLKTNGAYFLEVQVEKQENIYPVIPAGKAVDEMLLTPEDKTE
jgi:acetolactate synthase-1/2/3 large subunit